MSIHSVVASAVLATGLWMGFQSVRSAIDDAADRIVKAMREIAVLSQQKRPRRQRGDFRTLVDMFRTESNAKKDECQWMLDEMEL